MKRVLPILLAAGLSGAPALADPPLPAGCWMGASKTDASFLVQVWSEPPGGRLHFSAPNPCFLEIDDRRDGHSYSLTRPTQAKRCTDSADTTLSVTGGGDSYDFTLTKLGVTGTLKRDSATDKEKCLIK